MRDERRTCRLGGYRRHTRLPSLICLLPLILALPATAAEDEPEKWYQVEVIIFQQTDHYSQEQPRRDQTLQYPGNHLELFDPNKVIEELPTEVDPEAGPESTEAPQPAPAQPKPSILFTAEPEQPEPEQEKPFQVQEKSQRQLNNYATALRRRSGYQVLYHQAWRQPGIGSTQAPWILVRAGDRYGEHFELEGSLRLVRSRYLHLETDLWLSRFVENLNVEQQSDFDLFEGAEAIWPLLPEYPIKEVEPEVEAESDQQELSPDEIPAINFGELTLETPQEPLFQIRSE
ncbi:MAG: peptidoglycan binding protein CsiV, partial [Porticoccaceae bacterium]|nr:peptidoglycan binding protein CsiV [Porticoccaceae bacterium]